ncbi:MAG TPA: IclR family transcriptional regulator [Aquabacterium sp.]|nr:IclR family transcriptional regulator [Aquabacterium sp.]
MRDTPQASTSIQVLSRMFSLLDTLAQEGDSASLKVISERTGLHPSTAHRILNDLAAGGMVERCGPGSYRLGMRLMELGNLVKARLDVRELAARPMQELHRLTGHSVSLFVRQDEEALCVERTVSERSGVQVTRIMGLRLPLIGSVVGKVLLLNDSATMLQALTHAHPARLEALQAELTHIRQQGVAQDDEPQDPSHHMVAAPVYDDVGEVAASLCLNVSGEPVRGEWRDALKGVSQRISSALGWQHS